MAHDERALAREQAPAAVFAAAAALLTLLDDDDLGALRLTRIDDESTSAVTRVEEAEG